MIEVKAVSKTFGPLRAVDNVDLLVKEGEFLSLLGPSGCGKTTLLRLIAGFEMADAGTITLGEDVTFRPPYKRDVCQVFQSYALFPHMSVWKNVAFGLRMRKVPQDEIKSRVTEALAMVSLTGSEHKKPRQMSGGQQQRVALARAIVCRPKVLLLDEPLSALDAKLREAMQLELRSLHRKLGMTFLFVTHDQAEALTMSDRVAVMNRGKIEQVGAPSEVYLRPTSAFVANFVGQANLLDVETIRREDANVIVRVGRDFELPLAVSQIPDATTRLVALIRPEKIRISNQATDVRDVPVTIVDTIFTGATTRLKLRTTSGIELIATTAQGSSDCPGPAFARIDPNDLHLLKSG